MSKSAAALRSPRPARQRWLAYALLLINTLCWGAAMVIVKPSFEVTTPFRFLMYRFWLASLLALPIIIYYLPRIPRLPSAFGRILPIELVTSVVSLSLLYLGLARTTALDANIITTTAPVFVVLAGIWFLHEKEELREWFGLAIALGGTLLVLVAPIWMATGWQTSDWQAASVLGIAFLVAQNVTGAAGYVLAKKYYRQLPKLFVASVGFVLSAVALTIMSWAQVGYSVAALWQTALVELPQFVVWGPVVYMASFGSLIGLTAYLKGQDLIEASEASMFTYLQPLVYIPLAWLVLGERLAWWQGAGLLVVLIGVYLSQQRSKTRPHPTSRSHS